MAVPIGPQQSEAGFPMVDYFPEAATQTFKIGQPLIRDAAGFLAKAGTAPAVIYGFAATDGQNLAVAGVGNLAGVYRAGPTKKFEATLIGTLTQTMAGENYGLVEQADGNWAAVPADVGDQVVIAGWSSRVKVGDVDPIVDITVDQANIQEI